MAREEILKQNESISIDQISPDLIEPNPENPRIIFRQDELDALLNSISEVGIQVPITVYKVKNQNKYVILDGERRWRCSKKLNLKLVPALIRPEPSLLQNILIMFNIHNVRQEWDLLPMARKFKQIQEIVEKEEGKILNARELATITGVKSVQVARALELLDLPDEFLEDLMKELEKPVKDQEISEDFFIEAIKATNSIRKTQPEIAEKYTKNEIIGIFAKKYKRKVIKNIVKLRDVSRIARAKNVEGDSESAKIALLDLIENPNTTIEQAFESSVQVSYQKRDFLRELRSLKQDLNELNPIVLEQEDIKNEIKELFNILKKLIED